MIVSVVYFFFFFFNDTATTEIYTLSLHDALPISSNAVLLIAKEPTTQNNMITGINTARGTLRICFDTLDRKSTRLNSSHSQISYAVFCLKKKKKTKKNTHKRDIYDAVIAHMHLAS